MTFDKEFQSGFYSKEILKITVSWTLRPGPFFILRRISLSKSDLYELNSLCNLSCRFGEGDRRSGGAVDITSETVFLLVQSSVGTANPVLLLPQHRHQRRRWLDESPVKHKLPHQWNE